MIIEQEITTTHMHCILSNGSIIHRFSHVLPGCYIGEGVMIGEHCYVSSDVRIDDGCRIQNGNYLYNGLTLGRDVFIGPGVRISNHHAPEDRFDREFIPDEVIIKNRATIGINSTIIAPCVIGENAMIAGGVTVLRDIADNERYYGDFKDRYAEFIKKIYKEKTDFRG